MTSTIDADDRRPRTFTPGPNRYAPDPLAAFAAPASSAPAA
jgi:hypothetical protein